MMILYIIGGFALIILAVYFLDKRERMTHEIKQLKEQRLEIETINSELDDLQLQLNELNEPLSKLDGISRKILSYMK